MYIKVKGKQSPRAQLIKQIKNAQSLDELKSAMIQVLNKSATLNKSTQGAKRG